MLPLVDDLVHLFFCFAHSCSRQIQYADTSSILLLLFAPIVPFVRFRFNVLQANTHTHKDISSSIPTIKLLCSMKLLSFFLLGYILLLSFSFHNPYYGSWIETQGETWLSTYSQSHTEHADWKYIFSSSILFLFVGSLFCSTAIHYSWKFIIMTDFFL